MSGYADIAIPTLPRDRLTYAVPPGLAGSIAAGMRAVVPLGRRLVTGYIVGLHDAKPAFAVKPLAELLDPAPVFSPAMLRLAEWIASYYICSLGDALKAALPQGLDVGSERFVSLASADADRIAAAVGSSRIKRGIIDALSTGEVLSEQFLKHAVGAADIAKQLRELLLERVIDIESLVERPQARRKTVRAARLLAPWTQRERMRELLETLESRAPKQANLVAMLWQLRMQGTLSMQVPELLRQSQAAGGQLRALEEKGIIEVYEEEVLRELQVRYEEAPRHFELTAEQRAALAALTGAMDAGETAPFLLHGVTASGKTQVYIEAIRHALAAGRNAIVLVPEISLTPQLIFRFRSAFGGEVAVLHSRMSIGERYDAWRCTLEGRTRVVVGVRSAVFAPLANTGLLVVDEEHEASYKQSDMPPRYNARDVAVMRGRMDGALVLLGSATPSAESWQNAQAGKYRLLAMPSRIDAAVLPDIVAVDVMTARRQNTMRGSLSLQLIEAITDRIARGESSILLQNRRGYAPHLECRDCAWVEPCPNCSISLTYHKDRNLLRCHYCGATKRLPELCARCGGSDLELIGAGTQRIEEELREALPAARVIRMDLDTTRRKGAHDLMLTAFGEGEADVLLGTQMVAKGLDFERVTLVGVISADQSLLLPDFRASERSFQILTQVSGRSGRGRARGNVILQTAQPEHPVLQRVYAHDYLGFITTELEERRHLQYPPFTRLVLVECSGTIEERVAAAAKAFHRDVRSRAPFCRHHQPQPALLQRINSRYRYHLLIRVDKSADPDGSRLGSLLRGIRDSVLARVKGGALRVDIDVDPQQMM